MMFLPRWRHVQLLLRHPLRATFRFVYNSIVVRRKYARGDDYDAARYWSDRFDRCGHTLKGPGHQGLSERDNEAAYAAALAQLKGILETNAIDLRSSRVLEIGVGNGFYARALHDLGVVSYVGVDITDVLFAGLSCALPGYEFSLRDISTEPISGNFDLVLLIDVIEHIVTVDKLGYALKNVASVIVPGGWLFVSPIEKTRQRRQFHVCAWVREDVTGSLLDMQLVTGANFRESEALLLRKVNAPQR